MAFMQSILSPSNILFSTESIIKFDNKRCVTITETEVEPEREIGSNHEKPAETQQEWYSRLQWPYVIQLVIIPFIGFVSTYWVPLQRKTALFSILYFYVTGTCITAGYHRLWSHRSYRAALPLRVYLAGFGAGAIQGSIKYFATDHRCHHRWTDTDNDPYGVHKGALHAHILWLLFKQPKRKCRVEIEDLTNDPVVAFQHKNYISIALLMGWIFPTLVCGLAWDDWCGGFFYAAIIRTFFVNQVTFCVNSLAHSLGDQPFDDKRTARDHFFTALLTNGEGYHNFHHEFPADYRNGIEWYQFDLTKWLIWCWSCVGLADNLKTFEQNEIEKGRNQQSRKRLDASDRRLNWGTPINQLPVMDWEDMQSAVRSGKQLIAIEGVVHDVSDFVQNHPGGPNWIMSKVGKDGTSSFNGGVYDHGNAARNVLATKRIARLRGGGEVESLKGFPNAL